MKTCLVLLLTCVLAGCGTAPLSFIANDGVLERAHLARYPVTATAVDGSTFVFRPLPIAPGEHLVTFDAPPVAGFHEPVTKIYPIAVLPCTEYFFAADRVNHLTQDWSLVLEATRPIAGCDPADEMKKAQRTSWLPVDGAGLRLAAR